MAKGTFTTPVTSGLYSQRGGLDFSGKETVIATAAIVPQELGISLSIRIGMPMLAALMFASVLIQILEKVEYL